MSNKRKHKNNCRCAVCQFAPDGYVEQTNIFDEFETSPLATGSPMKAIDEHYTAEDQPHQERIFGRSSFAELSAEKQKQDGRGFVVCVKCKAIRPRDDTMNWGEGPIYGDTCNT